MDKLDNFCEKFGNKVIWIFIAIYVLLFGYICFLKYHSFSYHDWDFASDVIILWNSVHGRMLYYPFLEENIFGAHLYLIIFFFIPIYAVFQHPLTIIFMQTIFLSLAAYPLYLLAKLHCRKILALAFSLLYLLYPALGYINLFESHFETYSIFFLFFALYFFEKENFKKFLVFTILAMMCKENISIVVFMMGIYAVIRRKPKAWVITPLVLGMAWFVLSIKVIIPFFNKYAKLYQESFMFNVFYSHLGGSFFIILKNIVTHPLIVVKYMFTLPKISYLIQLFMPLGFLSILSPGILINVLPIFMQNLLSSSETHAKIYYHYTALLIPFIFYSAIVGFKKLSDWLKITDYEKSLLLILLLCLTMASGIYLKAPQFNIPQYIRLYAIDYIAAEKEKLVKLIPKDASVISTFKFLPKLANRYELHSIHFVATGFKMYTNVQYEPPKNLEYALLDFNDYLLLKSFFTDKTPLNISSFLENGSWKVVRAFNDIALFKKDYNSGYKLCEVIEKTGPFKNAYANIDNKLVFMGYDVQKRDVGKDRLLDMIFYWKRIGEFDGTAALFVQLFNHETNIHFLQSHNIGYRIYPPDAWPKGEIVEERYTLLVPPDLKNGTYSIYVGPFILDDKILPAVDSKNEKIEDINLDKVLITY